MWGGAGGGETHLAVIGALDLSFLSCLAYGKQGMTAVIRLADAVLQATTRAGGSIQIDQLAFDIAASHLSTKPQHRPLAPFPPKDRYP